MPLRSVSAGPGVQAALDDIARGLARASRVRVGFLEGATYPDGTSVALVAAVNEFGRPSVGQPPRPFFRRMISEKQGEWPGAVAQALRDNNNDAERALSIVGAGIAGQLRQSIVDLVDPPLAQSTIDRKGHDKPLIDTGVMLNAIDFEVE